MPNMEIIVGTQLSNVAAQTTLDIQGIVTSMKASGMSNSAIKDTLMADLTGGGRIFGNYRNQVKNTVKSGVSMAGSNASKDIFTKAGVEKFRWQTVRDGKVCPDCEERHGETGTMEYFKTIGLPASGFSVCTTNCRCQLVPESYKGENLDKPLVRGKKKISDITSPSLVGTHKKISDSEKWVEVNMVMAKDPGVKTKTDLSKFRNKNNTESLNEYLLSWDKARLGVKMDEVVAEIGDFGESAGVTKLVKENGIPNRMQNQRLSLFGPIWDLKPEEFIKFKDKFTKPGFNLARNIGDVATHEAGHAKLNNFLWLTRQKEPSFTKFKKTDALKVSPYARTSYQEYFSESNLARDRNLPIPSGIKKDLEKVDSFLKSKDKELLESAYEKYRDSLKLKNWEYSAEIAKEWDLLASEVSKKYSL
jgi:hypothetical protein